MYFALAGRHAPPEHLHGPGREITAVKALTIRRSKHGSGYDIGLDIAKVCVSVHLVDSEDKVVIRRKLTRRCSRSYRHASLVLRPARAISSSASRPRRSMRPVPPASMALTCRWRSRSQHQIRITHDTVIADI